MLSSPADIHSLPDALREPVVESLANGVTTAFLVAIPVVAATFVLAMFLREVPLGEKGHLTSAVGESVPGESMPAAAFE